MNPNTDLPLVTVITVVYNGVATLEQTILSVINQTYKNIEYIIIDGGSSDGSIDVIKKHASFISYWVSEKDKGIYDAMNKALKLATGSIIGILNSDDWYELDSVERIVHQSSLCPDCDVIHGLLRFVNSANAPDLVVGHYSSFLNLGMIEHPTCFIKRSVYELIGGFNTKYKSAADYEWMLRARNVGVKFLFLGVLITNFRRGGMSDSDLGFSEELLIKKRFGLISASKYYCWKVYSKLLIAIRWIV
jgi:glycosyltransferase involved in cell wall biosynthesis